MIAVSKDRTSPHSYGLLTGILILAVLYFAREVFIPLALAGLLAFILTPLATRLERLGLHRALATLIVIALSFSIFAITAWLALGQIYSLAIELPRYQQNVIDKVQKLHLNSADRLTSTVQMMTNLSKELSSNGVTSNPVEAPVSRRRQSTHVPSSATATDASPKPSQPVPVKIEEPDESIFTVAMRNVAPLIHPLMIGFIVLVFAVFILLARDDIRDRAIRLAGDSHMHVTTVAISEAGSRVSRYLLMRIIVNLSFGTIAGLALWTIGVPHPLLWAVLTGLFRFIPYVGMWMAASGPLLLALAASPGWSSFVWTAATFLTLEVIAANAIEPLLYGSSTGISSLAILVAAIFWTWIWGPVGLLLSTPLTVCLVVIGRHFSRLEFLGILLGEETALPPPQRFYQRILASDTRDAALLLEEQLKIKSQAEVYDTVVVPALSFVEEGRHSEGITIVRSEQILQSIEEVLEDLWTRTSSTSDGPPPALSQKILCIPAHDFADEISAHLVMHAAQDAGSIRVLSSDLNTSDLLDHVAIERVSVLCIVGTPPHTVRSLRLRCRQIRSRFPNLVVVACVLTPDCDLSSMRARIPIEDAQHVACSVQHTRDYILSLSRPVSHSDDTIQETEASPSQRQANPFTIDIYALSATSHEEFFRQIAKQLANSFDAPIALINAIGESPQFWKAQTGLPENGSSDGCSSRDRSICSKLPLDGSTVVVPDISEDERFAKDPFLREKGIRFYAGTSLIEHKGREIGSICILDTRPRQITDQQRESLRTAAELVVNAIELRSTTTVSANPSTEVASV